MNTPNELEKLRAEASDLRRRIATVERAWQQQTDRADRASQQAKDTERENEQLKEKAKKLEEKTKQLEEKVKILEARLAGAILHKDKLAGMIFKMSKKPELKNGAKRRTVGGQVGHIGRGRKKPVRIDEEKTVYLTSCPDCQSPVARSNNSYERIVEDVVIPAITKITKYTVERQWCHCCQKERRGMPANVLPGFRLGANALALILFFKYRLRLPFEEMRESLALQYGLKIRAGALANILQKLSKKLTPEYQKIIEEMKDSPVKHADETGWRTSGQNGWCWAFLSPQAVAYTIEETRGKGVPDTILGKNPNGVLVRDDYPAYAHLPMEQQSCWAHLLRNSRDALKQENVSEEMKQLDVELKTMFGALAVIVATPFDQQRRTKQYTRFLKRIMAITKRRYRAEDVKKIQVRITNQMSNLITALKYPNIPLTNNAAERQMRPVAVIRKISGGSRSATGAKAMAVNMSVVQTISLKKQPFFERLRELLTPVNLKWSLERTE